MVWNRVIRPRGNLKASFPVRTSLLTSRTFHSVTAVVPHQFGTDPITTRRRGAVDLSD